MSITSNNTGSLLAHEWICLQNQYDSYEKCSLLIKLSNLILCCVLLASVAESNLLPLPVAILWLQDAIWKTFQSRIGDRLLQVEAALTVGDEHKAMQFNSQWLASRPGFLSLLGEYVSHALKPTVAYPHAVLFALTVFVTIML